MYGRIDVRFVGQSSCPIHLHLHINWEPAGVVPGELMAYFNELFCCKERLIRYQEGHSSNDGTNDLKRLLTMDTAFPILEGVNSVGA